MDFPVIHKLKKQKTKIVLIYFVFGLTWIYWSDTALGMLVHDKKLIINIAVYKGSFFIILTSLILYFLISFFIDKIISSEIDKLDNLKYYKDIFNLSSEAIFIHDSNSGDIIDVNDRVHETFGYNKGESLNNNIEYFSYGIYPYTQEEAIGIVNKAIQEGPQVFEWISKKKSGELFWTEVSLKHILTSNYDRVVAVVRDINDKKKLEEEHNGDINRTRLILSNIHAGILLVTSDNRIDFVNNSFCNLFELKEDPGELIGISSQQFIEKIINIYDDPLLAVDRILEIISKDEVVRNEQVALRDNRTFSRDYIPIYIDGKLYGRLWHHIDITEQKRAELELKESEERFKALHNASFGGITIHDKGRIIACNQGLSEITGFSLEELIGMDGLLLIARNSRDLVMNNILSRYEKAYETVGVRKDGEEYPLRLEARVIPFKGKQVRCVEFRDITEYKKYEEEREKLQDQLIQAQKMDSVGRLAGGVAHDFNNMLGVILGYSDMALDQVDENHAIHSALKGIQQAAKRSAELTRQLLAFARKQTVSPKILDLNETIEGILQILRRLIGENLDLAWIPCNNLNPIKIDPSQIDQILANLCVNARDAIEDTGRVTIETSNIEIDESYCSNHVGASPGKYVMLVVSDNGCGMDSETLPHIFEPFFSTKEMGKGTGLGLAMVYGIVRQNGGFLNVYSELNQGTTFRIYFPQYVGMAELNLKPELVTPDANGYETVLLVEDEPMIREMTATMLNRLGYTVIPAGSPSEALRIAQNQANEIHMVMTDVIMPEMNGRDLARKLLGLFPTLRILFISGYTANVIAHHGVLDEGVNFLQKPFTQKDLAAKIRETLDLGPVIEKA